MGTVVWLSESRASHFRTARMRAERTFGLTRETAPRNADINAGGAVGPRSQRFAAKAGRGMWKASGASRDARWPRQPWSGLVAKPAHRISARRFAGLVAA